MRPLLRPAEVAYLLGLSKRTVYDLARNGRLPYYRLGDTDRSPVRFRHEDVENYISRHRVRRDPVAVARATDTLRLARRTA